MTSPAPASAENDHRATAVLFDFGGVLTSSVFGAFEALGASLGCDPRLPLRLLGQDSDARALLIAHEEGRIGERQFEQGFAARLRHHGVDVNGSGLVRRIQSTMRADDDMIRLVADVRAAGFRVGLLSNSLGDDCYAGFDLDEMFDAVTISGEIRTRKPSARAYEIACARLGSDPEATVMVDDLRQNIVAAEGVGLTGVLHREASDTARQLWGALGPHPTF
ncbi:HAD family phosphatase [Nocardia amamiensis]|uniref:HAD family phosphatase n=1 Tax=Nocardia amamiensis TaxID=404578 RepID=A0ABS0CXI1_9NOCA|nr:HAD family phosphatase [Nocardia amamiensis]MBF6301296.1 HAD family phosphatase [Nocardia amamiensis]